MTSQADRTTALVMRGLLHDLANSATAADGIANLLRFDGAPAVERAQVELAATTDRLFALHATMRSLIPDLGPEEALDPRELGAEVARLLAWQVEHPCTVTFVSGPTAPILGEAWRVRRQLLGACDAAAAGASTFRFSFRTEGDVVSAVAADGTVFWSAPTLDAARRRERAAG